MTHVLVAVLAVALGWTIGWRTHAAAARVERAIRPAGPHTAAVLDEIALGWQALEETCCLTAWESHGATHDTATCTRKDQTL
ncbi:hypothetical protein ELQ39_15840 [Streptomyces sp. GB4-14]|uniref:hypothetical protein n=1 Tax=Streptomyces sp. GB4-14 TaxID=2498703 RepID=UPI001F5EFEA8|nr:hypothetical protein [Streptomyces sp. GB4-14]